MVFNTPFLFSSWVLSPNILTFHYPQNTDTPIHKFLSNPFHFPQHKTHCNRTLHLCLQPLFFLFSSTYEVEFWSYLSKSLTSSLQHEISPSLPTFPIFLLFSKTWLSFFKAGYYFEDPCPSSFCSAHSWLNLNDQISLPFYHFISYKNTKFYYLDASPIWALPHFMFLALSFPWVLSF